MNECINVHERKKERGRKHTGRILHLIIIIVAMWKPGWDGFQFQVLPASMREIEEDMQDFHSLVISAL